jgi:hypothetical protein
MRMIIAAFLLVALVGHANALEWMSRDALSTFSNAPDGGFYLLSEDMMDGPLHCKIVRWPASEPAGVMACTGYGSVEEYSIEIKNETTLILGGFEYYRVD